jgi:SAM-dependent methyltransferase
VAEIRGDDHGYLAYHAPRYRHVLALAADALADVGGGREGRVLDVGPSPLSLLLARVLGCAVDTLGLQPAAVLDFPGMKSPGRHLHYDLNALGSRAELHPPTAEAAEPAEPYDLIVFAEVLEHLHVAPVMVLRFLHQRLAAGGTLLLQTPNAAALTKRLKLLAGRNPYDELREDLDNPGHVRESTLRELRRYAGDAGFVVAAASRQFYFDARFAHHDGAVGRPQPTLGTVKNVLYRLLPPSLRAGITLLLRRA